MKYCYVILVFVLIFKLNMYSQSTQHGSTWVDSVAYVNQISKTEPDAAIDLFSQWYEKALIERDTSRTIRCLLEMSTIQASRLNHGEAFDHSGEALFLAEEFQDTLLMAESYASFGKLNYMFNQKDASGIYLFKSCEHYKYLFNHGRIEPDHLISSYFNLALYNRWYSEYETALVYLDTCYQISDTINHSILKRAYLDAEKGQILLLQKQPEEAIELLIPTSLVFEDLIHSNDNPSDDKGFLVLLYSILGDAYRTMGEADLALFFYEKSIAAVETYKKHLGQKPYVLERYAWMLFEQGWYVEAYNSMKEAKQLNDRYFSARSFQNSDFITVKNRYRDELMKRNKELNRNTMALNEKEKAVLRLRIMLFTLGFLLILGTMIVLFRLQKSKFQKEKIVSLEKEELSKEQLELKNKELTASTLKLVEKEEMIAQLIAQMLKGGSDKEKDVLIKSVKLSTKGIWEDFNKRFMDVNTGFYERLQLNIPGLSPADQKICALIKLNFSGKEMAHLLGISLGSVHMARHRLRKKIQMKRDVSLSTFIASV